MTHCPSPLRMMNLSIQRMKMIINRNYLLRHCTTKRSGNQSRGENFSVMKLMKLEMLWMTSKYRQNMTMNSWTFRCPIPSSHNLIRNSNKLRLGKIKRAEKKSWRMKLKNRSILNKTKTSLWTSMISWKTSKMI